MHPHSSTPKLRNTQYVTDSHRIHVTLPATRVTAKFHQNPLPQKIHHSDWNPIRPRDDDSNDDTEISHHVHHEDERNLAQIHHHNEQPAFNYEEIRLPSSSSSSSPPSSPIEHFSSPFTSPTPANHPVTNRPQIYQDHENWLQLQRAHAARQLLLTNAEQEVHQQQPQSDTPNARSLQKQKAKEKIAAIYNRNIPQVDGYITDPSSSSNNTSPDTTSTPTLLDHHRPSFYNQVVTDYMDLLDRVDFMHHISPSSSISWDYSDMQHEEELGNLDPQSIFARPDFDTSFLPQARRYTL